MVKIALVAVLAVGAVAGFLVLSTGIDIWQLRRTYEPQAVPDTSVSAITSPPPSMDGINTHTEVYGTGADPNIITLGPKTGGCAGCPPYPDKNSMEFELDHGTPVLAPIDMVMIGCNNRNAEYRTRSDGEIQLPTTIWSFTSSPLALIGLA